MTVFVLSIPRPRTAASADLVGFTEGFKSLSSAEHCPPCIDCTVITGAETDVCWYTDGTLIADATFSASSVLSIQSETFVRLSSGVSTGEILLRLDPQLLELLPSLFTFQQFWPCGPPLLASLLSPFLSLLFSVVLPLILVSPGAFAILRALSELSAPNA